MTLRVANVGNLAGNANLNARFQRHYLGWESECFDYGRGHFMWSPQWEDADLNVSGVPNLAWVDPWSSVPIRGAWSREPWQHILGTTRETPSYLTQEAFEATVQVAPRFVPLKPFPGCRLSDDELRELNKDFRQQKRWPAIQELAKDYDVVVLYGPDAASAVALPKTVKVLTFECSTMRTVPQLDTPSRRVLAKAYQVADHCLLTNADCVQAARALGLERSSFVPHPVDTAKFCPVVTRTHRITRASLLAQHQTDLLFFAPARHALALREGPKANDKLLHAFAWYVLEGEAQGLPNATLLLLHYGDAVQESKALIEQLGISHRVLWMPPLPKVQYATLLKAADAILDQFDERIGSFGTTTIEGLACGKPVISFVSPRVHQWCKEVLPVPPVLNAVTVEDICARLKVVVSAEARAEWGERGVEWVRQWQSPERVCQVWEQTMERIVG